jgi:hypothetical protein
MSSINQFFKGFKEGMDSFGQTIAIIINSFLLTIVYIFGVGITSIIAKLSGKHFLETKVSKKQDSYWSDHNLKKKPIEEYYRQF